MGTWFLSRSGVFVKLTHSGARSYVQLAEAYRDDSGRSNQRMVATLGRLDRKRSINPALPPNGQTCCHRGTRIQFLLMPIAQGSKASKSSTVLALGSSPSNLRKYA
jgi:hypothetical protein